MYWTLHPTEAEYMFFSSAQRTFSRMDHMLGHKTSISKLKKIEIISGTFFNHSGMKLETNSERNTGTFANIQKWKNSFLVNQKVKGEITKEVRKSFETKQKHNVPKLTGYSKKGEFIAINTYNIKEESSQTIQLYT